MHRSRRSLLTDTDAGSIHVNSLLLNDENESTNEFVPLVQVPQNQKNYKSSGTGIGTGAGIVMREIDDTGIRIRNLNRNLMTSKRHHQNIRRSYNNNRSTVELNDTTGGGPISAAKRTCHGCCCIQCVRTNEVAILSRCGEFHAIKPPGLLFLPTWPCVRVEQRISLRVEQLDLVCETKTKDNGE